MLGLKLLSSKRSRRIPKHFPVFKTIKLGTHKSASILFRSLKNKGIRFGSWATDVLSKITLSESEMEVNLHVATVMRLTGKWSATYAEIQRAIYKKGYTLCPAEVALQLREQYLDQPVDETLQIAIAPVIDSAGRPNILNVSHFSGKLWVTADYGCFDHKWHGDHCFVFMSYK